VASLEPSVAASFHRSVPLALRFPFRFSIERHFTRRAHFEIKSKSQPSLIKSLPKAWANLSFFKIMSSPTRLFFKEIRKSISVLHQFQNEESCNIQRIFLFFFSKKRPHPVSVDRLVFWFRNFFFARFLFFFIFRQGLCRFELDSFSERRSIKRRDVPSLVGRGPSPAASRHANGGGRAASQSTRSPPRRPVTKKKETKN